MFQPQSTPFAFHASPYQYCQATDAAQSYNHHYVSQPQHQSPQGDAGYGVCMGGEAGLGGMMIADEDGRETGLRMGRMGGVCDNGGSMSDYSLPPTSLAGGGAVGVGVGRGGGRSGTRAVAGAIIAGAATVPGVGLSTRMGLVMGQGPTGHGDGMGRPLGFGPGTADGVDMDTNRRRSMESQSRSHQRPPTGGEAAGRFNMLLSLTAQAQSQVQPQQQLQQQQLQQQQLQQQQRQRQQQQRHVQQQHPGTGQNGTAPGPGSAGPGTGPALGGPAPTAPPRASGPGHTAAAAAAAGTAPSQQLSLPPPSSPSTTTTSSPPPHPPPSYISPPSVAAVSATASGPPVPDAAAVAAAAHLHHNRNYHPNPNHDSPGASSSSTSHHSNSYPVSQSDTTYALLSYSNRQHSYPGAASSSSSTASPAFYNPATHSNSANNTNVAFAASSIRTSAMEPGDPSDLAAQEAAARDYQPHLDGPLVGDKITSEAITDEYAKADDVYIAKTINLPQTYSHYRPIQGDGNCGWRAIGFSYFEHLVNNGDQHQILGEAARIQSLDQYLLRVGGYDRMLFEDMVEETIALLKDLAQNIANPQLAMHILLQRFNEQDASNAIIYHLRLLASSWLKGNPESYEPFIPAETGIAGYCGELERPNREIEHLGIALLAQVLLKPVNFVLEIAYLDRTPGNQVNIYRFPDEANGQDPANLGPIIYLLYRPDHYDILYKSPLGPSPLNLQVNRVASFSHRHEIASVAPTLHSYTNLDYGPLAMLPGFGGPASGLSSGLSSLGSPTSTSPLPDAFDPPPHPSWLPSPYSDHMQQQQQQQRQQEPVAATQPHPQTTPQSQPPTPAPTKPSQPVDYQLRFSHQCWHLNNTNSAQPSLLSSPSGFQEPSFTTAMFKNSHFNKAHYNNPHFHPEEWTPDDEGHHEKVPSAKKKGKVRADN
ncbi:Ubiquitin thioesterase OTUB1 [Colletotrichum tanaceti]|uniref:ubiquitinyl hydrolase 1 n=1 Tax=Colletotrichum tanaceti TaxID=1306861 RepID=A0A4U6XE28_9PEZI|nr:Ubiquitin thioesterase OTUB1 [Colletotrichum tanaceti]TKW53724.1 Ubiquitin thioesterase OTUB1 [Colletotrichum tanaceti]